MNNISIIDINHCYGCQACENICPTNAIKMTPDIKGFLYPEVQSDKCVYCGKCLSICQIGKENSYICKDLSAFYAVNNLNLKTRMSSKSGGVFPLLAVNVIMAGGIVYGSVLDSDMSGRHERIDSLGALPALSKSKYVQSNLGECYKNVKEDLQSGKRVLFSGTACQCHAIKNYLNENKVKTDTLLLIDIVCHGVPSPAVFKSYITWIEKKYKSRIKSYTFRDKKKYGWGNEVEEIVFENGKTISSSNLYNVDFFWTVYKHEMIRDCCYTCSYTTPDRVSDITLGDFWGIDKAIDGFNDKKGTSLVICHTQKGRDYFDKIKELCRVENVDRNMCLQANLCRPSKKKNETDDYWEVFLEKGFEGLYYSDLPNIKTRLIKKVKKAIGIND